MRKPGKGLLRNIMVREGFSTHEIMLVLVQNGDKNVFETNEKLKLNKVLKEFPDIKTIIINSNMQKTNVVLSKNNKVAYGDGTIEDKLSSYIFKISPNSFYQINPAQTEKLYNLAIDSAKLKKEDILCDLYCGIGTIGIFASKYVKRVYGVEIVEEAIENAKENAKINGIGNIEFILGDVEIAFNKMLEEGIKPSVVIVDPPRKGLDNKTIKNLCSLKLDRLVYVSCNPATLMRDLQTLENIYKINSIIPVDNFCYSSHVEVCTLLELKKD